MAKYTEERMLGMLTDINRSEKRNAYKKYDLPKYKKEELAMYPDGGGIGTLNYSPYALNTFSPLVSNSVYNPSQLLTYTRPHLASNPGQGIFRTPIEVSLGLPYDRSVTGLTNPALNIPRMNPMSFNDYTFAQNMGNSGLTQYQVVADFFGKDVNQLTEEDLNTYEAQKTLGEIKPKYTAGKPIDVGLRYSIQGMPKDQNSPIRGGLSLNAGYNPQAGFFGGFDAGAYGLFGNIQPGTYLRNGLTKPNEFMVTPSLTLAGGLRQKVGYLPDQEKVDTYKDMLALDAANGTDFAAQYYEKELDADLENVNWAIKPEIKVEYKPFRNVPVNLEGVLGANIDLTGKRQGQMDQLIPGVAPYGKISAVVPINQAKKAINKLDLFENDTIEPETEDEYRKRKEQELIDEEEKKRKDDDKERERNKKRKTAPECPEGSFRRCYTIDEEGNVECPCEFEKSAHPRWLQFGGELDKFVGGGGPGDKYYKNNGEQYKKTSAGQWFVWNPTYNNWQYAENGFHNNVDLEKYKASYTPDDGSWDNDKPKSNVAKPGTVTYYEQQRNKTLNSPLATYDQKVKATNAPLASNVPIRNELDAQKAAEEARIAAEKKKAEDIARWYEQEKEARKQDALMFGNNPTQVADATRVDVGYLSPLVGESMRAEADKQRQEDEVFTSQEKVLKRGFKNIYDYENDPMGRAYDEALAAEARWRASGGERPMVDRGEMAFYSNTPQNAFSNKFNTKQFSTGYDKETGLITTNDGTYDPRTGQFSPTPTYYSGSGALQGVDWMWTLPFAAPAAIEAVGSLAALEIPGMYGATLGSAANAGFIGHGLYSLPNTAQSWVDAYKEGKGDYRGALENTLWNTLDFAGLGEARAGMKSVAQDVKQAGNYLTTKTPLKNTYKINPLAPKLGEYNRVVGQDAIADLQNSGVVRAGDYGGVRQQVGSIDATRTTPYPSFGQGSPRNAYIQQTIEQGKTPYIISTDRAMEASTLGRHGKGSTMFPVDETGKYMESFPASEVKIFEGTPHWFSGYTPVSTEAANLGNLESKGLMASDNSAMFKNATNTPDLQSFSRDASRRYQRVSKQEMDDFLAQNPGKEVDVVRQDNWPGVLNSEGIAMHDPFNQTRALQKSEFDQATEFATKWAVKDPVAYQKVMDDIAFTQKRIDSLYNNGNNAMTEMANLQKQWLDDYVKQNPGRTASELENEYNMLRNSNKDYTKSEYYQVMTKALQQNAAASPEVRAMYDAASNLQNTVQRLNTQIQTITKNTDSMMDPTFKAKVEDIYDAARRGQPSAGAVDINGRSTLVYGSEAEPSFLALPLDDQKYLTENWQNIGGVRTGNKTITLGSRPEETVFFLEKPATAFKTTPYEKYPFSISDPKTWKNALKKRETGYNTEVLPVDPADVRAVQIDKQSMVVPSTVGEIQAHEVGHDLQKFYGEWIKNLEEYRPDLQYSTGHSKNPIAKEFNEAMVNPTAPVPNPMKPGATKQSSETWKSSVGELHSELMLARYKAAKHLMSRKYAEGSLTMDEAIAAVKQLEKNGDDGLLNFYLEDAGGNLTKHFKGETSDDMKKALIQILPAVVPAAVVGAGMMSGESGLPENRYGGNIKNLSKFIKK